MGAEKAPEIYSVLPRERMNEKSAKHKNGFGANICAAAESDRSRESVIIRSEPQVYTTAPWEMNFLKRSVNRILNILNL